ncbi:hypothetical protein PW52_11735 [Tamlana sedimentorum]|uniref:Lipocalin-like domain-containing protein n=1 Tax=Neotamlana sedimentorum TaxID=1435349 RepID=A0A0D7WB98_9FLAO|nr:hypothetical protein [Tamlana sedimentorum]KJD35027.1 hypothetical protein PW52_11735 [Tamlana sedimentorum]
MNKTTIKIIGGIIVLMLIAIIIKKLKPTNNSKNQETKIVELDKGIEHRKKFAGAYTTEIKGKKSSNESVEMYALNENGGAKWLWIKNNGKNGAIKDDEKIGTWNATENSITIKIKGNTEMIEELFILKDNVLVNDILPNRYLKKVE